ncbi:ABC transporter permease, partial [Candidatus Pacearchaeota archaeon]|nr:ABC transporter permease [Candidatus Pacearchaeota archaeon]
MLGYCGRRILLGVVSFFVVITIVFFTIRLVPGGPAVAALGRGATREAVWNLRERWGLNRPLLAQYLDFLYKLLRLDLGKSYKTQTTVRKFFVATLPYTFSLTTSFLVVGLLVGLPLGIVAAIHRNSWIDYVGRVLSLSGMSTPDFYLGIILLLIFSLQLDWFPAMGVGESGKIMSQLHHLVLPSLAGGLYLAAYVSRFIRSSLLNVLGQEYITTARAKGLKESATLLKHALRNALIPIVTLLGIYAGVLLGSSILIEIVFTRPGLGRLIVGAIKQRDYQVLQAALLFYSAFVLTINLLVDLSYAVFDPRVRYK